MLFIFFSVFLGGTMGQGGNSSLLLLRIAVSQESSSSSSAGSKGADDVVLGAFYLPNPLKDDPQDLKAYNVFGRMLLKSLVDNCPCPFQPRSHAVAWRGMTSPLHILPSGPLCISGTPVYNVHVSSLFPGTTPRNLPPRAQLFSSNLLVILKICLNKAPDGTLKCAGSPFVLDLGPLCSTVQQEAKRHGRNLATRIPLHFRSPLCTSLRIRAGKRLFVRRAPLRFCTGCPGPLNTDPRTMPTPSCRPDANPTPT